jgi:6-phosphogluconolactonase
MSDAGTKGVQERRFADPESLFEALAEDIALTLGEAVKARGAASLVVSGGTTPGPLFDRLADMAAPWAKVSLTLADERWVSPDSIRSNERLVRERLLRNRAAAAWFTALKTGHDAPEAAEAEVTAALRALPRPFDLILLGLGDDGHTASLIPRAEGLARALDAAHPALVRAIRPGPSDGPETPRLSMTPRALLDSRRIVILFTGRPKWGVFQQALEPGEVRSLPVRSVLRQTKVPVDVWWAP